MKKTLLILCMLALLSISAGPASIKLVRLTVVNKSGLPVEIRLTGSEPENFYYLHVPAGDRSVPTEKVFTIVPDTYSMQSYYIELWDPVYGASCGGAGGKTLHAARNIRVTFLECNITPRDGGEPSMVKYTRHWRCIY